MASPGSRLRWVFIVTCPLPFRVLVDPIPSSRLLGWSCPFLSGPVCSLLGTHNAFVPDLVFYRPYLQVWSPAGFGLFYLP